MSADQAKMRAQERNYRKIDAAVGSGVLPKLQKTMNVTLKTLTGGSIKLVSADGTVTPEGQHYYNNAGVAPPSVFAYEQPLESGKWVRGFDGKKKLVRKWGLTSTGTRPRLALHISSTIETHNKWSTH